MLLPVGDKTLLSACIAPLVEAGLELIIVVLGDRAEQVRQRAGLSEDGGVLKIVVNEKWREGMASSLRCGLSQCGQAGAVLVALGDEPTVPSELVKRMVQAWRQGASLVVPVHGDRSGHPVLFDRALWPELVALSGDVGGREVVRRHFAEATLLPAGPFFDIDTEEDYKALIEGKKGRDPEGLKVRE